MGRVPEEKRRGRGGGVWGQELWNGREEDWVGRESRRDGGIGGGGAMGRRGAGTRRGGKRSGRGEVVGGEDEWKGRTSGRGG